tara:strand:+ start:90 stop:356 length:267 start_codon:yes stop_codon:yes gene_type:complete
MFKKLLLLPFIAVVLVFTGCETTNKSALDAAIAEMKATLEAKDAEQDAAVASANTTAQRAEAMTEQNRSALRALNDKIDRMFKTISRK